MQDGSGFNAQTEAYEDLVKAGVTDPTKVVRSTFQNAASIASLLLTTEAIGSHMSHDDGPPAQSAGGGCGGF